jgi:hypothetical protein
MPDNYNQSDIFAFNQSVRAVEGAASASRGGRATFERAAMGVSTSGMHDYEVFQAIARGAPKTSGLHWLCRINGVLSEYLGSWGAVAFLGIAVVGAIVALKQNASTVWNAIRRFVSENPLAAGGIGLGIGAGVGYLLARDEYAYNAAPGSSQAADAAVATLETAVSTMLPVPVLLLAKSLTSPTTSYAASAPAAAAPESTGGASYGSARSALLSNVADAYDAYDAYDSLSQSDAYDAKDDDLSGNIGV